MLACTPCVRVHDHVCTKCTQIGKKFKSLFQKEGPIFQFVGSRLKSTRYHFVGYVFNFYSWTSDYIYLYSFRNIGQNATQYSQAFCSIDRDGERDRFGGHIYILHGGPLHNHGAIYEI
jgi:hypothetical protein